MGMEAGMKAARRLNPPLGPFGRVEGLRPGWAGARVGPRRRPLGIGNEESTIVWELVRELNRGIGPKGARSSAKLPALLQPLPSYRQPSITPGGCLQDCAASPLPAPGAKLLHFRSPGSLGTNPIWRNYQTV